MLSAGCQRRNRSSATSAVCSSQTAAVRSPRNDGASCARRRQKANASPPAAPRMHRASSHTGHLASSTKLPFEKTCGGYLKKNSNMVVVGWLRVSVRHCVDHIVHADPKPERGILFRILRIVGMLPRIAKVHIVTYGDHQASL